MDHMMPGMDGLEATAGIREFNRDVPIIALTANAVSGMKEMFIQNGMNGLLPKPIELSKLNETLDKWISEEKKIKYEGEVQTDRFTNIDIKGIDAESGLVSLGGNKDVYVQTLETYRSDLKEKPFQVKNALSSGDIPLFTTYVHALKSASASVGAKDFSESARALEAAGRQEDLDYISRWTPKLLEDLNILAENIEKWLKANQNPNLAETGDGDELRDLLRELKEAVININAEEMNRALSDLQAKNWGDYASPAIADIAEDTLMCEYDSAVIKIDNLLFLI
jgi:CheY-like chemotaxis protein